MNQQQIDDLIIRFFSNETSFDENQIIGAWINESEANHKYFESFRNLWLASAQVAIPTKFKKPIAVTPTASISNFSKRNYFIEFSKVAAIFVFAFLTGAIGYRFLADSKKSQCNNFKPVTIESSRGAMSVVVLPDGTRVWLNSGSKLLYDKEYNENQRMVTLVGEAYFDVITNPSKPFVVRAGKLAIKAMGTSFNVKAYPEDYSVVTTLVKGKVIIEGKDNNNKDFAVWMQPKQTLTYFENKKDFIAIKKDPAKANVIFTQNEKSNQIVMEELSIIKVKKVKTELYTSWRDANWVIEKQNLYNLARQLERRYSVVIDLRSENIKNFHFSGTIQNETIEQIMEIMRNTMPLKFSMEKGKIIVEEDKKLMKEFNR